MTEGRVAWWSSRTPDRRHGAGGKVAAWFFSRTPQKSLNPGVAPNKAAIGGNPKERDRDVGWEGWRRQQCKQAGSVCSPGFQGLLRCNNN